MPSTVRDVASLALVKLGVSPLGDTPDATSVNYAMGHLQASLLQLLSGAMGRLYDVSAIADVTAFPGLRIRCDAPGITMTLPLSLPYDWQAYSPGWYPDMPWLWWGINQQTTSTPPPRNMDCAVVIDYGTKLEHVWVYNAYAGAWTDINSLTPNSPFPLAEQYAQGFAAMIALDMMDTFPEQSALTVQSLQAQAARCKMALATKFDNRQEAVCGEYY